MADTILHILADTARERVAGDQKKIPLCRMRALAEEAAGGEKTKPRFPLEETFRGEEISFICEVKKASPSRGIIAEAFPYLEIAKAYEEAGAACISVLTEPSRFLGSDRYLEEIAREVKTPLLRKDFTVDVYQIYQAKALGASMVLLICALLSKEEIREAIHVCDSLGMSALVEAHDEEEIKTALDAGARIIGVNNRNLKDFSVDVHNSERLRSLVPPELIFVAESGIRTREDIRALCGAGVNAVLIGETLMRSRDKKAMLDELRRGCEGKELL